ncbi:MAG: histidine phosphatase family protein [Bellilinea sp.]|nr:histidine phosphatase family protein [Bellilinea sp.]
MTLILLIRHGENDVMHRRLAGRLAGVHLNENGRKQAQALARALEHAPIEAVYSSPLERALETAQPLAETRGLTVQIRPALSEVDYGDWQGRTYKQLRRAKLWKTVQDNPASVRFPNGETLVEVQQRVIEELEHLARLHTPPSQEGQQQPPEAVIAAIAHGDIIRLALVHYLNMAINDFHRLTIFPASLSLIRLQPEQRPLVIHINQIAGFSWPPPPPAEKPRKRGKAQP